MCPPMVAMGVMAAATIASTMAQSNAQRAQGSAQQTEANYVQAQENVAAGQAQASGQRASIEQQRQTSAVLSNAVAAGAGQGGTSTDPTVISDLSKIGVEGNYRAMTAMYQGDAKAQGLVEQGNTAAYQGQLEDQAANTQANTTLINGASSLFSKYASPYLAGGATSPTANAGVIGTATGNYYQNPQAYG